MPNITTHKIFTNKSIKKLGTKKLAFSLIELSVVILIVGILVLGVTKGTKVLSSAKLASAASLTAGSPVRITDGLSLWLDATDKNQVAVGTAGSGVYGNPTDNADVTDWKNKYGANLEDIIFSAASGSDSPKYVAQGIGNLPTIRFNGVNRLITTTSSFLNQTSNPSLEADSSHDVTIFLVEKIKNPPTLARSTIFRFISGSNNIYTTLQINSNSTLRFEYSNNTSGRLDGSQNIINDQNTLLIFDQTSTTQSIYVNSATTTDARQSTVVDFDGHTGELFAIGAYGIVNSAKVDIGELIIFKRSVSKAERQAIADYLSTKWGIKLN